MARMQLVINNSGLVVKKKKQILLTQVTVTLTVAFFWNPNAFLLILYSTMLCLSGLSFTPLWDITRPRTGTRKWRISSRPGMSPSYARVGVNVTNGCIGNNTGIR